MRYILPQNLTVQNIGKNVNKEGFSYYWGKFNWYKILREYFDNVW